MSRVLVRSVLSTWILAATETFGQLSDPKITDGSPTDEGRNRGGGDDGSVSGEVQVIKRFEGVVRVSDLSVGDVISEITGTDQNLPGVK